jgi:predicted alpha/beta-hydrolase family hydrolase
LHLPGQPEKSRLTELLTPRQSRLVVQGSKDSFGTAEELRAAIGKVAGITLVELPGVGHSYRIAKSSAVEPTTLHATLVTEVSRFIASTVGITTS